MSGEAAVIGPFKDGIRIAALGNPDSTTDAIDICNFDILFDGTLHSRKVQKELVGLLPDVRRKDFIGVYYSIEAKPYAIFTTTNGTYAWDGVAAPTRITANIASAVAQYEDYLWIVCAEGASGKWRPTETFTAVSGMPLGNSCVIKNFRLLVGGVESDSKLSWSKPGDFNSWEGAGGGSVLVRPRDGSLIQRIVLYNDQVIIFKDRSIFSLSFTGDPGEGNLRIMSPYIGTSNPDTVAAREDVVMFYFNGRVYTLSNNNISDISRPLIEDFKFYYGLTPTGSRRLKHKYTTSPRTQAYSLFMTFVDQNKVMLYHEGYYWVYHLEANAWTRYEFGNHTVGKFIQIRAWDSLDEYSWFCGALQLYDDAAYQMLPAETDTSAEAHTVPFECRIRTKGLIFGNASAMKRLFHWGVDSVFRGDFIGTAMPYVVDTPAKWSEIAGRKWSELGTWNALLGSSPAVVADAVSSNYLMRTYTKFPKGLRFRRIQFNIDFNRDKNLCIVYTITAFVSVKQLVFAKES